MRVRHQAGRGDRTMSITVIDSLPVFTSLQEYAGYQERTPQDFYIPPVLRRTEHDVAFSLIPSVPGFLEAEQIKHITGDLYINDA